MIGMTVDAVHEVVTVPTADIEPPPAIYRGLAKEYLRGVVRVDQRMFVVLDAGHLLGSTERIEMEHAMRTAPEISRPVRYSRTSASRRSPSARLYSVVPMLQVWPSTVKRRLASSCMAVMASSRMRAASGRSV